MLGLCDVQLHNLKAIDIFFGVSSNLTYIVSSVTYRKRQGNISKSFRFALRPQLRL